jgi:DNA-binding CsgD family transcriptional regulator
MAWSSIDARALMDASQIEALVEHLEDDGFDAVLLEMLGAMGPVAEVNGFSYAEGDLHPRPVSWYGRRAGTASRVDRYARGFHRFDPTLHSLPRAAERAQTLINVLAARNVGNGTYRRTCFEDPSLSQKISIALAGDGAEWTILNIYLSDHAAGEGEFERIAAFGSLVAPFVRRRGRALRRARDARLTEPCDREVANRLRQRFPALSERERRVCALTMIGKSSGEIAAVLGIRPGTVLTYRRRAYERLGISSAAALVPEIL